MSARQTNEWTAADESAAWAKNAAIDAALAEIAARTTPRVVDYNAVLAAADVWPLREAEMRSANPIAAARWDNAEE
jgi:hypothetical protein